MSIHPRAASASEEGRTPDLAPATERVRPEGPAAVKAALIDAATALLLTDGPGVSVREIARRAGVNHGLVHTYFGSKHDLLAAAMSAVVGRAEADLDDRGYPPPDLATRRDGELGRAVARVALDDERHLQAKHPIVDSWIDAIRRDHPDLAEHEIAASVATSAALALGWAVFGDHLSRALEIDEYKRSQIEKTITSRTAELGHIDLTR